MSFALPDTDLPPEEGWSLDPATPSEWESLRLQGHRMLDDMFGYIRNIRARPVWQPIPDVLRSRFRQALPSNPADISAIHEAFMNDVLPHAVGNAHPGFMGWVHGGGTVTGMLAEMVAAGLNANLGGRDQMPAEVERQIVHWMRSLFHFPETASGLFVTGTSMANLVSLWVARSARLGPAVREEGMAARGGGLRAYAAVSAHRSIAQAMDLAGFGTAALRSVPVTPSQKMDVSALSRLIAADRAAGLIPFLVVGTAGTVDVGAVDELAAIADVASRERLWFHVDGAYGALAMLAPSLTPLLAGIERADSIAFDFHKWGQVPYDAGFVLIRDETAHRSAFASAAPYLHRETRGLAGGAPWFCDYGPDLSRSFKALKTWFTLSVHGTKKLGESIAGSCQLAQYLKGRIEADEKLELLAPVTLNVVCFRYRCSDSDTINAAIVMDIQESGLAAPSTTTIGGQLAIRAAIVNHRTTALDIDALVEAVIANGDNRVKKEKSERQAS
jgi:aromatic-L-amino-acid decarboxylase